VSSKRAQPVIALKRVYDPPAASDGHRFLAERLWPRGMKKEALKLDGWLREVAPSTALRQWFGHDPVRWEEFERRYHAELDAHPEAWQQILDAAEAGPITLLFSARDTVHNNVVALRTYLLPKRGNKLRHV
jgi:uncharacterized protein YeaO (DUF488 family)